MVEITMPKHEFVVKQLKQLNRAQISNCVQSKRLQLVEQMVFSGVFDENERALGVRTAHVVAKAVAVLHLAAQHDAARLEPPVRVIWEPCRRLVGRALQLILRAWQNPSAAM